MTLPSDEAMAKGWADCPTCGGRGFQVEYHASGIWCVPDPDEAWDETPRDWEQRPCPVCLTHFAAVDAAVAVEREANAVICDGFEESEMTAATFAAAVAIRARGGAS
jgi:hypothetical protein